MRQHAVWCCAVITTTNIVVIVYVLCAGMPFGHVSNLEPFAPFGMHGIFAASSIVFFSFVGFDGVITAAEEVSDDSPHASFGCHEC